MICPVWDYIRNKWQTVLAFLLFTSIVFRVSLKYLGIPSMTILFVFNLICKLEYTDVITDLQFSQLNCSLITLVIYYSLLYFISKPRTFLKYPFPIWKFLVGYNLHSLVKIKFFSPIISSKCGERSTIKR